MGTRTPWGTADHSEKIALGVMRYDTPTHGGYHLSAKMNAQVHSAWRKAKGWYEEDAAWSIVAMTFPQLFDANNLATAKMIAKNDYPHGYMAVTGESLSLEESVTLREEAAREKHKNDFVVISAWGRHEKVPAGMVGVCASLGGVRGAGAVEKWFIVPEGEYDGPRSAIGFVIDPNRHAEVEKFA